MTINMQIKELENINISADDDDVTVTRHEDEATHVENETPEDLRDEIISQFPQGENGTELRTTVSESEIADIVKKQLENSSAQYCDMSAEEVIDLFDEFRDKDVDMSKFDYNIYTRDFYAERFPGFDPRFYECLEKASHEKFVNQADKKDWRSYTYENGEFVLSFGGTEDSEGAHGVAEQHQECKDDASVETEAGEVFADAISEP